MRHVNANRAALVLALFLVASAALFGWWRSQGLALVVLVDETRIAALTAEEGAEEMEAAEAAGAEADDGAEAAEADDGAEAAEAEEADWAWEDLGERTYAGECSSCHGRLPHVPSLAAADGGRDYLVDFLLYGFDGEAVIDGATQSLDHLAFDGLADEEAAAVLDHMLATFGEDGPPEGVALFRPDEIEGARGRDLSAEEVASSRPMN